MTDWEAYGDCPHCGSLQGKPCASTRWGLGFGEWILKTRPHRERGAADRRRLYVVHVPATGHIVLHVRADGPYDALDRARARVEEVELGEPLLDCDFHPDDVQIGQMGVDRTLI